MNSRFIENQMNRNEARLLALNAQYKNQSIQSKEQLFAKYNQVHQTEKQNADTQIIQSSIEGGRINPSSSVFEQITTLKRHLSLQFDNFQSQINNSIQKLDQRIQKLEQRQQSLEDKENLRDNILQIHDQALTNIESLLQKLNLKEVQQQLEEFQSKIQAQINLFQEKNDQNLSQLVKVIKLMQK